MDELSPQEKVSAAIFDAGEAYLAAHDESYQREHYDSIPEQWKHKPRQQARAAIEAMSTPKGDVEAVAREIEAVLCPDGIPEGFSPTIMVDAARAALSAVQGLDGDAK